MSSVVFTKHSDISCILTQVCVVSTHYTFGCLLLVASFAKQRGELYWAWKKREKYKVISALHNPLVHDLSSLHISHALR